MSDWLDLLLEGETGPAGPDAATATRATLAALLAPPAGRTILCREVGAAYVFDPASAATTNGWTVIAATDGTAGRWLLDGRALHLAPMSWSSFAQDLWPLAAAAGVELHMYGSWTCDVTHPIPSYLTIHLHRATITSTQAATGSIETGVFFNVPSTSPGSELDGASAVGDESLFVVDGDAFEVGDWIAVVAAGNHVARYQVKSKTDGDLTLDRPVMHAFAAGTDVLLSTPPIGIRIIGDGAVITGTGDTAVELSGARDCLVQGIRFLGTAGRATETVCNLDVGAYRSAIRDCEIDALGADSGANLESAEDCEVENVVAYGAAYGILITNSYHVRVRSCRAYRCGRGLQLAGGLSTFGARSGAVSDSSFDNNTNFGVEVDNYTLGFMFSNVRATHNDAVGIAVNGSTVAPEDITFVDCDVSDNGTHGFYVVGDALGILVTNLTANRCGGYAVAADGDVAIDGLEARECGGGGVRAGLGARVRVSRFHLSETHAAFWAATYAESTAALDLRDGRIESSGGGTTLAMSHPSAAYSRVERVTATGCTYGFLATVTTGGLRRGAGVDFSGCVTPYDIIEGGELSFGTVTINGTTPVTHPYPAAVAGELVTAVRKSLSGSPAPFIVAVVAGAGIRVTGTAGDTSTVEVALL